MTLSRGLTRDEIRGLVTDDQLREIWEATPDLTPYTALRSSVPLDQKNPQRGALAEASKKLALEKVGNDRFLTLAHKRALAR